jgi:hypothetical protein
MGAHLRNYETCCVQRALADPHPTAPSLMQQRVVQAAPLRLKTLSSAERRIKKKHPCTKYNAQQNNNRCKADRFFFF